MKEMIVVQKEKGTENVTLKVTVTNVPESPAEWLKQLAEDTQLAERSYYNALSNCEVSVKRNCGDGEVVTFKEGTIRSERKTQENLMQKISALIIKVAPSSQSGAIIPQLITLQNQATKEFKGHAEEYFNTYYALHKQFIDEEKKIADAEAEKEETEETKK